MNRLRRYSSWCLWDSKKRPIDLRGNPLSITKDALYHFDEALNAHTKGVGEGLGFVFRDVPFTFIDLDHCVRGGMITTWATDIIKLMNSYYEESPSGEGIHIYIQGRLRDVDGMKQGNIEVYSQNRYATVNMETLMLSRRQVEHRQKELDELVERLRSGTIDGGTVRKRPRNAGAVRRKVE